MPYFTTPPLPIVDLPTEHQRLGLTPRIIVLHATAGRNSRAWLQSNPRGVSIPRLIEKDGTICKMAPDTAICGHVGFSRLGNDSDLNNLALGIEFENLNDGRDPYPAAQVASGAAQVVEWWGLYGFLPILSHGQIDTQGKTDPRGFPWPLFYQQVAVHLRAALVG